MLSQLVIQNFRKFDRYALEFGRRNLLVGSNNVGKSTAIEALRLISIVVNRLGNLNSLNERLNGFKVINPALASFRRCAVSTSPSAGSRSTSIPSLQPQSLRAHPADPRAHQY